MILTDKPIKEMNEAEKTKFILMKSIAEARGFNENDFSEFNPQPFDFRKTSNFSIMAMVIMKNLDVRMKKIKNKTVQEDQNGNLEDKIDDEENQEIENENQDDKTEKKSSKKKSKKNKTEESNE